VFLQEKDTVCYIYGIDLCFSHIFHMFFITNGKLCSRVWFVGTWYFVRIYQVLSVWTHVSETIYIIMLVKQFSNIEEYVKYVLQIFEHIICNY
jgi:hypothetical protein